MIYSGIRQLCAMSLLCGAALTMTPEGGVKRVAEIVCTASLIIAIVSPLKELDMGVYAVESARLHELETQLTSNATAAEERLNRLVIEQEYEAYIMDKASELGIGELEADVEVQWSLDGFWIPYGVKLKAGCSNEDKEQLSELIEADLGIPYERQRWHSDG